MYSAPTVRARIVTAVAALSMIVAGLTLAQAGVAEAAAKPVTAAAGEARILDAFNAARADADTPAPALSRNGFVDEYAQLVATAYAACNGCANPTLPVLSDVIPTALDSSFRFEDRRAGTIASTLNEFEANAALVAGTNSGILGDHYGTVALVVKGGYVYEFAFVAQADFIPGRVTAPTPTITGTSAVGRTLTANAGAVSPADATVTFRWTRSDGVVVANFTDTYVPTASDIGKSISVSELITKDDYQSLAQTSKPTAKVAIGIIVPGHVAISGHANLSLGGKLGTSWLTAVTGTWSPADVSFTYQWYANGRAITGETTNILDLPTSGSIKGKRITVRVTGTEAGYRTAAKLSGATAPVGPPRVPFGQLPELTGDPTIGSVLTATNGTPFFPNAHVTWEWTINGKVVPKATKSTFVVPAAAFRKSNARIEAIRVATAHGYATTIDATPFVIARPIFFTTGGQIHLDSTTPGHTLTVHVTGFDPAPTSYNYVWTRDNVIIPGATKSTLVTSKSGGHVYAVNITASRPGYVSNSGGSNEVVVNFLDFNAVGSATITPVSPGQTLAVTVSGFVPAATSYTYQWYMDGKPIAKATKRTLVTSRTGQVHDYKVDVTGHRTDYNPQTTGSNSVSVGEAD